MEIKIKSADTFYEAIEDLVWEHDINYIDAVVLYCEINKLEIGRPRLKRGVNAGLFGLSHGWCQSADVEKAFT